MKKNLQTLEQEFEELCADGKWEIAAAMINDLWKKGRDTDAENLRKIYMELQNDFVFVPVEEVDILPLTPEEDDAPAKRVPALPEYEQGMWKRLHIEEENREPLTNE